MTNYDLTGRTVLVTGAASGIGAATSRGLIAAGAKVALLDLHQAPVDEFAAELGPNAFPIAADVTDLAGMQDAVAKIVEHFGSLDVCFANAGIAAKKPVTINSTSVEEFERIIEVDLLGVWRTVRACLPAITAAKGHILLTSSIYAFYNGVGNAPYAMAKTGVEAFGRALRGELAGIGTTAGVLYPGMVDTPIMDASLEDEASKEMLGIGYPGILGRVVPPEFIANAVIRGIERRRAKVIAPKRWSPLSFNRGVVALLTDTMVDRHKRMQHLIRQIDR